MNQTDTSAQSDQPSVDSARTAAKRGREFLSKAAPYLRRGVESDAVTATVGGTSLLGGLRALRNGDRGRGLVGFVVGTGFVALTLARRRFRDRGEEQAIEETDVTDTGPDVEAVADEAGGVGGGDGATDEAVAEAVDTSPDVEGAVSNAESESESDAESAAVGQREVADTGVDSEDLREATESGSEDADDSETEDVDRLGEAALDGQSREVPAPQSAFDRGFLAHSAEAFWGIRSGDNAVFVSQDYDAVEERDGVHYVASSEIGADVRELPIPDAILNHWNDVLDEETSVTGGDDVLFVTTDSLAADGLLRVLPSRWADDRVE
ncbi:hypothetical protein [Haloarcula nitratireducens]|uniref:Uncharacterized protein n=1 Tax=Haloarcula nitratireducens TaxID=2487749 RepID=A0AAW4P7S6_9EURY|nr:hypothetical protein [Halomicroarcula nitratireducens]MBX0293926.1 hypothetical protein [Halomicroarcula nitratireducens]